MKRSLGALIKSMNDNREGMRNFAINKIVAMGGEVIPQMIELLPIKEGYVQDSAVAVLIALGPAAIPALIEALDSDNRTMRWAAAAALGQMGPEGTAAVDKARKLSGVLAAQE